MWQNLNHLIKNNSYGCKNPKVEFKKKKKKKTIVEVRTLYDLDPLHHPGVLCTNKVGMELRITETIY
jgi:hypothetical protein